MFLRRARQIITRFVIVERDVEDARAQQHNGQDGQRHRFGGVPEQQVLQAIQEGPQPCQGHADSYHVDWFSIR